MSLFKNISLLETSILIRKRRRINHNSSSLKGRDQSRFLLKLIESFAILEGGIPFRKTKMGLMKFESQFTKNNATT